MELAQKKLFGLTRATWENIGLYIAFAVIYCMHIDTLPAKLEGFESWVIGYLPMLDDPWPKMWRNFVRIESNDSNCSVNSPPWFLLIRMSINAFGDTPFAYRLPDALLTAFVPMLAASFVRRFYRPDWALWVGILTGAHHHTIWFARTGGYIGPTATLFLLIVFLASIIAFENKRWPWIPLSICLLFLPFFYSAIRYYFVIGFIGIGYQFITSSTFRKKQLAPMVGAFVFLVLASLPITRHGLKGAAFAFISARGEQLLITEGMMREQAQGNPVQVGERLKKLTEETVPTRLRDVYNFYGNGRRFFLPRHQDYYERAIWYPSRPLVLGLFGLGALWCLYMARNSRRYALPVMWSIWAWIPLLLTTGIYPGRLLLGIPADVFMIVAGAYVCIQAPFRWLPEKVSWIPRLLMWMIVIGTSYYCVMSYFRQLQL